MGETEEEEVSEPEDEGNDDIAEKEVARRAKSCGARTASGKGDEDRNRNQDQLQEKK